MTTKSMLKLAHMIKTKTEAYYDLGTSFKASINIEAAQKITWALEEARELDECGSESRGEL